MGLNLQTPLYIGGVDQSNVRVSADVSVERGFTGCISQVTYLFRDCLLSPVLHFAASIARVGNLNHTEESAFGCCESTERFQVSY